MPRETNPTLAGLAKLYRERADGLDRDAGWADAQPDRRSYHDGLANHCRFMAADWYALADLVDFA
ncbi:MAG TPA: hypothetical protein VGW74_14735, partial [Propionibacteriaceae bacterium]|nr:hypothetical protein [Propionibacteriaceae bacterium]